MKKEQKNKKSAKKVAKSAPAPVKAEPKKAVKAKAKVAAKPKAKKAPKKVAPKKPVENKTGAQIADLLKNTLVTQSSPAPIAKKVETVPLSAAAPAPTPKPVENGVKLNAQSFRPAQQNVRILRPFTRLRAAGV